MLATVLVMGTLTMNAQEEQKKDNRQNGQKQRPTEEQMQQMQCNRVANELLLDNVTTAKFIPLYKNYLKELKECRQANQPEKKELKEGQTPKEELTDTEVEKRITGYFSQSRKMLDIKESYYKKFREFLSPKQIQKMYFSSMMADRPYMNHFGQRQFGQDGRQGWNNNPFPKMKKGRRSQQFNPKAVTRQGPQLPANTQGEQKNEQMDSENK